MLSFIFTNGLDEFIFIFFFHTLMITQIAQSKGGFQLCCRIVVFFSFFTQHNCNYFNVIFRKTTAEPKYLYTLYDAFAHGEQSSLLSFDRIVRRTYEMQR